MSIIGRVLVLHYNAVVTWSQHVVLAQARLALVWQYSDGKLLGLRLTAHCTMLTHLQGIDIEIAAAAAATNSSSSPASSPDTPDAEEPIPGFMLSDADTTYVAPMRRRGRRDGIIQNGTDEASVAAAVTPGNNEGWWACEGGRLAMILIEICKY
jgi:hypothetical protein